MFEFIAVIVLAVMVALIYKAILCFKNKAESAED
jgi:hypothetical protein